MDKKIGQTEDKQGTIDQIRIENPFYGLEEVKHPQRRWGAIVISLFAVLVIIGLIIFGLIFVQTEQLFAEKLFAIIAGIIVIGLLTVLLLKREEKIDNYLIEENKQYLALARRIHEDILYRNIKIQEDSIKFMSQQKEFQRMLSNVTNQIEELEQAQLYGSDNKEEIIDDLVNTLSELKGLCQTNK